MRLIISAIIVLGSLSLAHSEQFVFWEYPGLHIPREDSIGVLDTININQDILIEDINVYIGINTEGWAGLLGIPFYSPWQDRVYLINFDGSRRYLNFWFDTDGVEDGPGELEQYVGHNARGMWVINPSQPNGHFNGFTLNSWAIEVIGQETGVSSQSQDSSKFGILENYPNPFNTSITIRFAINEPGMATLKIYNILGQEVATLFETEMPAAIHTIIWNAGNIPSGVYYCSLKSNGKTASSVITLAK
jgi:subtilisin-like proprotein convertase family protein